MNPLCTPEDYELFLYKHVPPDIKHNRIPAPGMSFIRPNLPALIQEIEALVERIEQEASA